MNKINKLFKQKNKNILSLYFTAGFPKLNDTSTILNELEFNRVDMIEIGMPFSDPLADGLVIQNSSEVALKNGMNIKLLFEQLSKVDIKNSQATHLLMGYLNPVLQYGVNEFCKQASELGIDGVIIPDLPLQEFIDEYKTIFEKYHLKNIFLITPQTSESRIRLIDKHSNAFIYMVSSTSTTGVKAIVKTEQENYFKRILAMKLNNPLMIGFGISDNTSFNKVCEYANGAIIGSAFINAINNSTNLKKDVNDFVSTILKPKIER